MIFFNTGLILEAAVEGGLWKKLLQHSQENKCAGVSSTRQHATRLKRDSKQVFSCQYCEIFKKTYFEEHLRTAASLIFSQDVFTLGGRGSRDVYVDISPIKMELFAEITSCYFLKKLHLMFEICFKWFSIWLCITWKHERSFELKEKWLTQKLLRKRLR